MDTLRKREILLNVGGWLAVFVLVPLGVFLQPRAGFSWGALLEIWLGIFPFLLLYMGHDLLAAPFLARKQYLAYIFVALALLALFIVYSLDHGIRPPVLPEGMPPVGGPFMGMDRPAPPDGRVPMEPEVMKVVMGVLVVLVNLGVKAVFNLLRSERRMQELRAETLDRKLETLRYQINPHFFMNTLNNIHALVDVDPERAKESIEEFSKIMRVVLYEGSSPTISLRQEADFLRHYVSLMRLRYPESVQINLSLPEQTEGAEVPPLLMASFVENAFKHGVSYEAPSFVRISLSREEHKIVFNCENSRHSLPENGPHGLGLENIRKRLDLLYDDAYTLQIDESPERYGVSLVLPERKAAV